MKCDNCGFNVNPGDQVCMNCGAKLSIENLVVPSVDAMVNPVSKKKDRNLMPLYIAGIVLGIVLIIVITVLITIKVVGN